MKYDFWMTVKVLFASAISLSAVSLAVNGGEASGGGVPELVVVSCGDAVQVGASGGNLSALGASVVAKDLTSSPVTEPVQYQPAGDEARFLGNTVQLDVSTELQNGSYPGTLTLNGKSIAVTCERLDDHFRPIADRQVTVSYTYGAKEVLNKGIGPSVTGGFLPTTQTLDLKFNPATARLEGNWKSDQDLFGTKLTFEAQVSQKRGEPLSTHFFIWVQGEPFPTEVTADGDNASLHIFTPAMHIGSRFFRIREDVGVSSN